MPSTPSGADDASTAATKATTMPSDDNNKKKESMLVSSWIHNEGQCVTLAQVAMELGVSRLRAVDLLEREAANATSEEIDEQTKHRVTWCEVATSRVPANPSKALEDDVPCAVFRLVSGDVVDFQKANEQSSSSPAPTERTTICAVSLGDSTESVEVAHERDLARCRDALATNPRQLLAVASSTSAIALGPEMQALWNASLEGAAATSDAPMVTAGPSSSAFAKGVRTKTTASSFFGSGKGGTAPPPPKSTGPAATAQKSGDATKTQREDEKENKESGPPKAEKNLPKKPTASSGKSGHRSAAAAKPSGKVGTADDFVGDMDTDSDDDDDDDVVMAHRNDDDDDDGGNQYDEVTSHGSGIPMREPTRSKPSQGLKRHEEEDDDEDANDHQTSKPGPMDEFVASHAGKPSTTTRRRKRVVEKTFKDEHGYLQTELQEVWEDVPVEESSRAAPSTTAGKETTAPQAPSRPTTATAKPAPKKPTAGKTAMKQGSLKGFFAKK